MHRVLLRTFVRNLSYVQGQSPSSNTREYFYYIDHQGQLFLDDTRVKNFITCFKDIKFLAFFFRRIKPNTSGRYEKDFPFISPCGPETNYIRCDDLPVVFTHLLDQHGQVIEDISTYGQMEASAPSTKDSHYIREADLSMFGGDNIGLKDTISREILKTDKDTHLDSNLEGHSTNASSSTCTEAANVCLEKLSYGGSGNILTLPFHPKKLCMLPESGRIYHAGPAHLGGVGLVKSSLAIELSRFFLYEEGAKESHPPVMFRWRGKTWTLDNSALKLLHHG